MSTPNTLKYYKKHLHPNALTLVETLGTDVHPISTL